LRFPKPSFIPAIIWFLVSTFLLTIPGSKLPSEDWLDRIWFDKWVHIAMFAIMVFLWCLAAQRIKKDQQGQKRLFVVFCLIWFGYGIGMEFVQKYLVAFRSFDIGDIIADGVGCLAGLFFSIRTFIKK
jgi:hypothetical protein